MTDDHEERLRQHEEILRSLTVILTAQHACNQEQREINQRLTLAIERLDVTQAHIETILSRMRRPGENGRES